MPTMARKKEVGFLWGDINIDEGRRGFDDSLDSSWVLLLFDYPLKWTRTLRFTVKCRILPNCRKKARWKLTISYKEAFIPDLGPLLFRKYLGPIVSLIGVVVTGALRFKITYSTFSFSLYLVFWPRWYPYYVLSWAACPVFSPGSGTGTRVGRRNLWCHGPHGAAG